MSEQAFLAAIRSGDAGRVKALLADRPELARLRQGGASAILLAQYYHKPEVAAALRPYCRKLDVFEAAALGDVARLRALLDAEPALLNAVAEDGFGPLGLASFFGHEAAARLLVERGAEVARASDNAMKVMPLHSAAAARSVAIARLLLNRGAPVDARQGHERGCTPLMEAALNGQAELVELLLRHGADPRLRDAHDKTAADHAREAGHKAVAERLAQAQAR